MAILLVCVKFGIPLVYLFVIALCDVCLLVVLSYSSLLTNFLDFSCCHCLIKSLKHFPLTLLRTGMSMDVVTVCCVLAMLGDIEATAPPDPTAAGSAGGCFLLNVWCLVSYMLFVLFQH